MHGKFRVLEERMKAKSFEEVLERLLERSRQSPWNASARIATCSPSPTRGSPISPEGRLALLPVGVAGPANGVGKIIYMTIHYNVI